MIIGRRGIDPVLDSRPTIFTHKGSAGLMIASSILFLALAATLQDDDEDWVAVTFKEGNFVVEMPVIQDQEGTTPFLGPGGQGTLHDRLRQTNGVIYNVKQYENRRPIPKADEARWLDFARDKAIGAKGKSLTEKKIQLGTVAGREFAFQNEPFGGGKYETRARAYVKGSILIVLVVSSSMSNQPLPPKADRFLDSFAFGTKPSDAGKAAAKVAEETDNRRKGAAPWKVVRLLENKATVEMPGETAMTGGGNLDAPLRRFFCMSTNAEGAGVQYSSLIFQGENRLAASDEAKGLEVARERAVMNFGTNGKVVSDRPIQSRAGPVREFELTIDRRPGVTVKARCRAYVDGNVIVVLMAVSKAKGQDLPSEAGRFLDSLAVKGRGGDVVAQAGPNGGQAIGNASGSGMIPVLKLILGPTKTSLLLGAARLVGSLPAGPKPPGAMANSRPPETGANMPKAGVARANPPEAKPGPVAAKANALKAWGTEVDPDGDVVIQASGRSLAMQIPGSPHVLAPERNKMNAPRVLAPARGDFVVAVRVDGAFRPSRESTVKGLSSRQAGGLVVWKDPENYLVFQHRATSDDGKVTHQAVLEELVAGSKGVTLRQAIPEGATFLRLERKRGRITVAYSVNGKEWKDLKPVDTTWAEGEVQVGVVAVSTSTGPHPVMFDGYSLKAR
jgi:regulation of enolase protein 1 (concanavalin A-like superfamily)